MENSKSHPKYASLFVRAFMLLIALVLVVYFVSVLINSTDFFDESAEKNARIYFEEDIERAEALAAAHYENLYEIVEELKYAIDKAEVEAVVASYIGSEQFGDLRYYSQGVAYAANGVVVEEESSGKEYIEKLAVANREGCSPVYYDVTTQLDCIAFFVPIRGSDVIDGILSILPARNIINVGTVINEKASAVAIINFDGKVLSDRRAEGFDDTIGNNFYTFITDFTHNKLESDSVSNAVAEKQKCAITVKAGSDKYTLAISPLSRFDDNLLLVSLSESDGLIAPEVTYIRHIINLLIIAVAALIIGYVFAKLYQKRVQSAMSAAELEDSRLGCPNAEQFRRNAKELLTSYRQKYTVLSLAIKHFFYIEEQLGGTDSTALLNTLVKIVESTSNSTECYGYCGDGKFLLLVVNQNSHALSDRIKLIETIINREDILKEKGIKLKFSAGAYNVFANRKRTVKEMIDCANTACATDENNSKTTYTLFTEEVKAQIEHNEKIEAVMESALQNREFKLFLQPKYDVKRDTIHSAEALVRWFDPRKGDYRFPGEFIPLFESNGFIVKLDHFVYTEVLEYLSHAVERGEKVVPVAVNVSRVTATSPDFVNFYVGNKKKYGIPDGFITLELTESFAMEDYDKIAGIVSALHNNGMLCSIDDFGSGYSSFSILKQLNVDELKLDSVFVRRGLDVARDDKLLSTIIELGKFMGMSVVQEGIETKEMFDKVVAMGCNVIQGYYYAKAISVEEFKIFINTNTSIRYKSLVK